MERAGVQLTRYADDWLAVCPMALS
jgi:hypothetical protein